MIKIIEFLRNWTTNLVIFIIIISFLEMILPAGSMRRFVKVTIGLIIILVIINPFIKLVQGDIDIENEVFKNIENQYNYRENDYSEFESSQDHLIEEMYIEEIKKQIEHTVIEKTDYVVVKSNIKIDRNKNTDNYGGIEKIALTLEEGRRVNKEESTQANKIKAIRVDVKVGNISDQSQAIDKEKVYINNKEIQHIKDNISTSLKISKEQISIDLQTKD